MRAVIQRVTQADVHINKKLQDSISNGLVVLLGFEREDTAEDIDWLVHKILQLRVFGDPEGKMNLSVQEISGEILVVSQFTLHASTKKGNRPSFIKAAKPEIAIPLYQAFLKSIRTSNLRIAEGIFGADMQLSLTNDGPVTIIIDTKQKE